MRSILILMLLDADADVAIASLPMHLYFFPFCLSVLSCLACLPVYLFLPRFNIIFREESDFSRAVCLPVSHSKTFIYIHRKYLLRTFVPFCTPVGCHCQQKWWPSSFMHTGVQTAFNIMPHAYEIEIKRNEMRIFTT